MPTTMWFIQGLYTIMMKVFLKFVLQLQAEKITRVIQ